MISTGVSSLTAHKSDCGPTAAFEKPQKMGRMMLLRHAKCDKSDNKYYSYSDEENEYERLTTTLPALCSDSDPDLELQLMNGKIQDDHVIPQDETEVGDTDKDELKEALKTLADDAKINRASIEFANKLRELPITYHNAFRLGLWKDPPADVRPLKIELKQDAKPKRIHVCKYAPPQAQFLTAKMADMERLGLVKKI
jgi:hypothetical protein